MSSATPGQETRPAKRRARTPAQIEAEIRRTREDLAAKIDVLADRVKPANVVRRGKESVRAQVTDRMRSMSPEQRAAAAAAAVTMVGVMLWRRSR